MVNNWKPILAAVTIFSAGFVTGGLTWPIPRTGTVKEEPVRMEGRRGPKPERKEGHLRDLCSRLQDELRLTPAQREEIEEIVRLAHERVKVVADQMGPLIHSEFKQMEREILQKLTTDQAVKFEAMIRERESRFGRGDGRPPGPPPQGALPEGVPPGEFAPR